ncbi:MAG: hypothetical protein J2P57_08900 [Acidimicrobiaceae bacterium]|nr:hypothetical protein [Acidimicrobiaceae bacterium]
MIELRVFRLAPGADEAAFLASDKAVQSDFAYQQPGLLRRTTARSPSGDWLVLDLWRSEADADRCAALWASDPAARKFMGFVDRASVRTARFEELPG